MIGIVTFADSGLKRSLDRFESQANVLDVFDVVSINSEYDLSQAYRELHRERMFPGSRGFGYWCWKPYIMLKELEKHPELDILFYADAGCHLRVEGRSRLMEYIDTLEKSEHQILAFQGSIDGAKLEYDGRPLPDLTEAHWTKGDMFAEFGIGKDNPAAFSPQLGGGIFAVKNTETITAWLRQWIDLTASKPYLFDDTESRVPNYNGFLGGRHDQSYFSLAAKRLGAVRFSSFEYWYPEPVLSGQNVFNATADWATIDHCPFHARRDKPVSSWHAWTRRLNRYFRRALGSK